MAPTIHAYPRSVLIADEQDRPPFMNNLRGNFYTLFFSFPSLPFFLPWNVFTWDPGFLLPESGRETGGKKKRKRSKETRRRVFKRFPRSAKYYEHSLRKVLSAVPLHLRHGTRSFPSPLYRALSFYSVARLFHALDDKHSDHYYHGR